MRNTLIISACLTLFALIGTAAGQQNTLNGTSWKLIEANGTHVRHSSAALVLNSSLTMFSGNTGCNQMSGTLSVRGRKIDFGRARTTKRFCKLPEGSIPETTILNGLESTRRFDLHGGELRLLDRRGRVVLRFARDHDDAGTDQGRLDGVRWVLESIKGRQTYVPLPYAFIKFDAKKGSAGGDTSCNVFGGDYSVKGSRITFSNIISTMRACVDDDAKMATERDLLDGLQQADRFELRDDHLFLYRGREILLNFRAETKQRD